MRRILAVAMVFSAVAIVFIVAGAHTLDTWERNDKSEAIPPVDDLQQLQQCINNGVKKICLTKNVEISSPIFVTSDLTIVSETDVVMKRSMDFLGEMFIIGEGQDGNKAIYDGKVPKLTLGDAKMIGSITIDGNSDVSAMGSVFLIVSSGQLVMNDNVTVQNANKVGNERLLDSRYITSSPENIGGAAVDIISGAFIMNGGVIKDCKAVMNTSQSYMGGAIYNYGDFHMYGGKLSNNEANRGAAVYNYKTVHIYKGTIDIKLLQNGT